MMSKPLKKPVAVMAMILIVVAVICVGGLLYAFQNKRELVQERIKTEQLKVQNETLRNSLNRSNKLLLDKAKSLKQSISVFQDYSDSILKLQVINKSRFQAQISDLTNKSNDELRKIANN